jgi:hypothetical protein
LARCLDRTAAADAMLERGSWPEVGDDTWAPHVSEERQGDGTDSVNTLVGRGPKLRPGRMASLRPFILF